MKLCVSRIALATCAFGFLALPTMAQDAAPKAAEPAPPAADQLPAVDVVQQKQKSAKKAAPAKKKSVAKKSAPPIAEPTPVAAEEPVDAPASAATAPVRPGTGSITSGTVNMSPVSGSDLPIEKVPTSVGRASSEDFNRTRETGIQQALQSTVPGVFMNDSQGNAFQGGVQFRGFESSPINGAPQGIAVYQNGTRINEVFGDVVNWDFIPSNAVDSITVLGSNPVYGLNAIGGAIGITMRDGFNFQGAEFDTRAGSYGRIQGSAAAGAQAGNWGIFGAVEGIKDSGYRDFGDSEIKRMYADLGYRSSQSEFHLSFTGAKNEVGVTAAAPDVILDLDWGNTFTSPQINENEMAMVQLSGVVKATERLTLAGQAYYRRFRQDKIDGNILDQANCADNDDIDDPDEKVCVNEGDDDDDIEALGVNEGDEFEELELDEDFILANRFGVIDKVKQDNESFGGSVQAVDRSTLFGFRNQFLIGASWDHGEVNYGTESELGVFQPRFKVRGIGITLDGDDFFPRQIDTTSDYFGVYFTNTTDLTDRLALTLGGRYNYARLELDNKSAPALDDDDEPYEDNLTGSHTFVRFNPTAGLTYQLAAGLTAFGGYSEANRAPTAAELSCADPENPCLIESLLVADPPLAQVVSKTFEIGLRGNVATFGREHALSWSLTGFHTRNYDDIISIADEQAGRGYFDNVGQTQRQGVEAALQYRNRSLFTYASYSFTDAEFRENLQISAPDNPIADDCPAPADDADCVFVSPGDRLPGIPRHKFKAGFNYYITSKWAFGSDMIAASDQVFFGDEGNDNDRLAGFAKFNLHTSYQLTDNIQIYGLVDNVFDTRYGLFGTYYDNESAEGANLSYQDDLFEDDASHRTKVPAPPVTAYGGVKVRF
ncbi:MAG: TonB-dependent receptor [Hyphomicrobiaceae bacterium]|nr:TonB-dependent receptor [Hyphomicrobiaceae bacterium]